LKRTRLEWITGSSTILFPVEATIRDN